MTCRRFNQERYERELERFIRTALQLPDGVLDVQVRHVPSEWMGWVTDRDGQRRYITDMDVIIGAMPVYFTVRLHDWPLERGIAEDLGARFVQALGLLLGACSGAQDYAFEPRRTEQLEISRSLTASGMQGEAAERLEPDPQPRLTSPLEEESSNDIF